MKPMTKIELHLINKRVNEIEILLDQDLDDDIYDNIMLELDGLIEILEKSCRIARIRESGLKLVS